MRNRYLYITLLAVLGWNAEATAQNGTIQVPRLVVSIAVDQLDGDYLETFAPHYGKDGFKRLMDQGMVFERATYPMAHIDRASAISSVITGTTPYYHSIVAERWINKESLRPQHSTENPKESGTPTPANLQVSTLGDEMKMATQNGAHVFAIAPFRDAAILSAGHAADGAIWLDEQSGRWTTSSYYPSATDMVATANNLLPRPQNKKKSKRASYEATLINANITELALRCVVNQSMGADPVTDLLCLTYYAGTFRSLSLADRMTELEDTYLRLDQDLGHLITSLEQRLGQGSVLVVLTSTGYSAPDASDYSRYRIPTGTFYINRAANLLNMYFGAVWGQGRYIETFFDNQLFINHQLLEQKRISLTDFTQRAREFLQQMEGVRNIYTSMQLLSGSNEQTERIRNSFHPQRSGDILIEVAPGWHLQNEDTGEDRLHQASTTPFPIILYGPGITPARIPSPVTVDRIAPTVARIIRIRAPNACSSEPLF